MLVPSRRIGERIHIGDGIVVTVIGSRGKNIQIGVEALADIAVDREEISVRKFAERRGLVGAARGEPPTVDFRGIAHVPATIEALTRISGNPTAAASIEIRMSRLARWALDNSPYRTMSRLECQVVDGVIILTGIVPTFYLKQLAQELLLRLDCDALIDNRVEVTTVRNGEIGGIG